MKVLLLTLILPLLFSFTFSPMTQTIELDKGQKMTQFQISNNSKEPIPISVKAVKRIQKESGLEDLPTTNEIKVFPPQLILPPGQKRTIRVDWSGEKDFKVEKAFRIIAEQVPLNLDKEKSNRGIKMLLRYMGALYVNPGKTKSQLELKKYTLTKKLKITIVNKGNAHQYLEKPQIKFKKGKKVLTLPEESLKILNGQNILAESTRTFELPLLKGLTADFQGEILID